MIEGKSIFRTYHEMELEIDGTAIRLAELKKELDHLLKRCAPKEVRAVSYDKLIMGSIIMTEPEVLNEIARVTMLIGLNEDLFKEKQLAFEDLKKRIRQTKNKLESDTTLNVFVVRVIEGKSPQEASRALGYELPTIFNAMVEINKHMGVSAL